MIVSSVPEVIRALPALTGYQLVDQAAVLLVDRRAEVMAIAVLTDGVNERTALESLTRGVQVCRASGRPPAGAFLVSHSPAATDQDHQQRCGRIHSLLHQAGLRTGAKIENWATDGEWLWPLEEPAAMMPLHGQSRLAAAAELTFGHPAASRRAAEEAFHPVSGQLRDDLADALPAAADAASRNVAAWGGALWRRNAITATINRLSDPQPLTGQDGAEVLLALSDPRVRAHVTSHTITALAREAGTGGPRLAADTGHLSDLVRHAPPGLIQGPALLLAATLRAGCGPMVRMRAAALAALVDDTTGTEAIELAQAAGDRDELLAQLAHVEPISAHDQTPPAFTTGPRSWPDPLAGYPTPGFDPLAQRGDPLGGPAGGEQDWWGGIDPEPGAAR